MRTCAAEDLDVGTDPDLVGKGPVGGEQVESGQERVIEAQRTAVLVSRTEKM